MLAKTWLTRLRRPAAGSAATAPSIQRAQPPKRNASAALAFMVTRPGQTLFNEAISKSHPISTRPPVLMTATLAARDKNFSHVTTSVWGCSLTF